MEFAPLDESIPDDPETLIVLFRIISRDSWRELQAWHESMPGSRIEHIQHGCYVLHAPPGGAWEAA